MFLQNEPLDSCYQFFFFHQSFLIHEKIIYIKNVTSLHMFTLIVLLFMFLPQIFFIIFIIFLS
uniref:Uncharacterized protein n=1 Tax=Rhizophagus irregularis (strain DAOM 181602 / DAOM 197198 / MUCL 43194) TaxID=747089 RepID=U9TKC5_RHIID